MALSVSRFPSLDMKEWVQHFSSSHFWQCSGDTVNLPGLGFSHVAGGGVWQGEGAQRIGDPEKHTLYTGKQEGKWAPRVF